MNETHQKRFVMSKSSRLKARRFLLFFASTSIFISLHAQEICDDGVDNDGDGAIDLNDGDCDCVLETGVNLFTNGSFETPAEPNISCFSVNNCPNTFGQLSCLEGWSPGGVASSPDAFGILCDLTEVDNFLDGGLSRFGPSASEGESFGGLIAQSQGSNYTEVLANCLQSNTTPGLQYTLQFDILGFEEAVIIFDEEVEDLYSAFPAYLAVYGNTQCYGPMEGSPTFNCPIENLGIGWELIDTMVVYGELYSWTNYSKEIEIANSYSSIGITGFCTDYRENPEDSVIALSRHNYYFFDDFRLFSQEDSLSLDLEELQLSCDSSALRLDQTSDLNIIEYQWYIDGVAINGATDSIYTADRSGTYQLLATYADGCIQSEIDIIIDACNCSFEYTAPQDMQACLGDNITISASSTGLDGISWISLDGTDTISGDLSIILEDSLIYVLVYNDSCRSLRDTVSLRPYEVQTPELFVESSCTTGQGRAELTGLSQNQIARWIDETGLLLDQGQEVDSLPPGTYIVSIESEFGQDICSSEFEFEITELVTSPLRLEVFPLDCGMPSDAAISILNDEVYDMIIWTEISSGNIVALDQTTAEGLQAGDYHVEVTDSNGCIIEEMVTISEVVVPQVDVDARITAMPGEIVEIDADVMPVNRSYQYLWTSDLDLDCVDCASSTVIAGQSGLVQLTVIDSISRCSTLVEITLVVDTLSSNIDIYVPNVFSPNQDGVNDVFGVFLAEESVVEIKEIAVFDRWGNMIWQSLDPKAVWDGSFKGEAAPIGVYTYLVAYAGVSQNDIVSGDLSLIR